MIDAADATRRPMTQTKILVVEDERIVARDIAQRLTSYGYGVVGLPRSGDEAVRVAGEERPDLVLMDIRLSGEMDGIATAAEIRSRYQTPVVYLTAYADDDTLRRASITEPYGYVLKPFDERELRTVIEMALYKHAAERKLHDSERRIRAAEEKYRSIFENAVEGIFQSTPDGRMITANKTMARVLGYDSPAALMLAIHDLGTQVYVDPAQRRELMRLLDKHGTVSGFEVQSVRTDGVQICLSVSARLVHDPNLGTLYEGTVEDITERKSLEEKVRRAEKMEAIGQLAGGVAHDFNNVLTVILNYCELMLRRLVPGHPMFEDVTIIRGAAERAAGLTRQLLVFGRKEARRPVTLDLNEVVRSSVRMLGRVIPEHLALATDLHGALWPIRADHGQLEQVIINLVVNARDAMAEGGEITIATRNVDRSDASSDPIIPVGHYVVMTVTDAGHGMDPATQARIFEPFFTTKEVGKGTGLGLATVYAIVEQSDGHIRVDSEIGKGTTFTIWFPVARARQATTPPDADSDPGEAQTSGTVLLVEDDAMLRRLTRRILESIGATVLEASDGVHALELSRAHPGPIHLVLTDVVMPRMTWRELTAALAAERPEATILYMSGYADRSLPGGPPQPGPTSGVLSKPFAADELIRTVVDLLERSRGARAS
jgi:two-component system, cell cycle sensor histidine kinase and response regulator CckA